jgi:hypothetical protein
MPSGTTYCDAKRALQACQRDVVDAILIMSGRTVSRMRMRPPQDVLEKAMYDFKV